MGMDGVFVGSGIFKSGDAAKRARAIVQVCIWRCLPSGPLFVCCAGCGDASWRRLTAGLGHYLSGS